MTEASFYRKPLPEPLVPFSSPEGKALFREALALGTMEGYFALAEQFHTQSDPAFCGLGTLVVALNALAIDPGRLWKGPWRWYSEEMLDCCAPLDTVKQRGVTLDQFACLARCNGALAEVRRAGDEGPAKLREEIAAAGRSPGGVVLCAAYSRRALGQTGDGHFSPVAGYHPGRDMALLLDVARFKYPPHWVPVPRLWEAMRLADPSTGKPRGYALLRRGELPALLYYRVSLARCSWFDLSGQIFERLPAALSAAAPRSAAEALGVLAGALPASACEAASCLDEQVREGLDEQHRLQVEELRCQLERTPLFAAVSAALAGARCCDGSRQAELLSIFLLLAAPALLPSLAPPARDEFDAMTRIDQLLPPLRGEVERLRSQLEALRHQG